MQYVVSGFFATAIAAFFALRSGRAEDAFLPGILLSTAYGVGSVVSIITRWPLVGFMVGSITGDPTAWHSDKQIVRLCNRLTWLLVAPCVLRVVIQAPIWLAGSSESMDPDAAVAALGVLKIVLGWPLQLAALGSMVWLLSRNHTPIVVKDETVEGDAATAG